MIHRKLAAGTAVLVVLSGAASAATIVDDGTTVINDPGVNNVYFFDAETDGGSGDWRHTFDLGLAGSGLASVSLTEDVAEAFDDLTFSWWDINGAGDGDDVQLSQTSVGTGITRLSTVFEDPETLVQQLRITWSNSTGEGFDGDVNVSTVPVPAAGLLLLGGLGALGVAKRRKS